MDNSKIDELMSDAKYMDFQDGYREVQDLRVRAIKEILDTCVPKPLEEVIKLLRDFRRR